MDYLGLSGPVIHIGVALVLAIVFRLNPLLTIFCAILPDLVDKPLAAFGIGGIRYIGHTLLFTAVVSTGLFLWKRKYGAAALVGFVSHLILDLNFMIPWFYPFQDYNFSKKGNTNLNVFINQYTNSGLPLPNCGLIY